MIRAWQVPVTRQVLRDDPPLDEPGTAAVDVRIATHETATCQLVLRADAETDVSVTVDIDAARVDVLASHYVEVARPSVPTGVAGWYPDAMVPLTDVVRLEPGRNQSVWVTLESDRPAGEYRGTIVVAAHDATLRIPLRLTVLDLRIPESPTARSAFAIWYGEIATYYGITDPDEHWATAERFYDFQLRHRVVPTDLPVPTDLSVSQYLARAEKYLDTAGVPFRIPYLGDAEWTRELVEALRDRGVLHRCYFYVDDIDEPTPSNLDKVREVCATLDSIAPDVPHLVTIEPIPELFGTVNAWVPLFDRFDADVAAQRQAAGEQVWWYGCIIPTRPYPTLHLDDDPTNARVVSWMQHAAGVDGQLYWATDIFGKYDGQRFGSRDVWQDPVAFPDIAGDGFLLYPGEGGTPLGTTRLEALHQGLVDYEYLCLLADEIGKVAATLDVRDLDPRDVLWVWYHRLFDSLSSFTRDAAEVQAVRDEVVDQLLGLRRGNATLAVFNPSLDVTLYAPPATRLEVDGIGLDVEDHGSHVRATHRLDLPPGRHRVTVTSYRGDTSTTETYVVVARDTGAPESLTPLPVDPAAWNTDHGTLSSSTDGELVFASAATGPLPTPGATLRTGSLVGYEALELEVRNAEPERSVGVFVRFHAGDTSHEAYTHTLWPAQTARLRVPLRQAMVDLGQLTGIEVGILQFQQASTIALAHPRLTQRTVSE